MKPELNVNFIYPKYLKQNSKSSGIVFNGQKSFSQSQVLNDEISNLSLINQSTVNLVNKISFTSKMVNANEIAQKISETLYKSRIQDSINPCQQTPCPSCIGVLKSKILPYVEQNKTIEMLMICFPFKLPSRHKTLGAMPDKAEAIALKNLGNIIANVEKIYKPNDKPGAKFTVYSDNLIFSEAEIHPSDSDARLYLDELKNLAKKLDLGDRVNFKNIETVEFFDNTNAPKDLLGRRQWLRDNYGSEYTEENLKLKMEQSIHYNNFVNGIKKFNQEIMKGIFASAGEEALEKRFGGKLIMHIDDDNYIKFILSEDNNTLNNNDSRVKAAIELVNKAGEEALSSRLGASDNPYVRITEINGQPRVIPTKTGKRKISCMAYKVLHLDQSWVNFINQNTKEGVRFSMHPQPCGSFKTSIELVPGSGWIQPWNSTAVKISKGEYILAKARDAKNLGCKLVLNKKTGLPSHYKVTKKDPNRSYIINDLTQHRKDMIY